MNSNKKKYSKKDVAAIIVTYNGGDVRESVYSVLKQVAFAIIVDNGSLKESIDYLKEFETDNAKVIFLEKNYGQAIALNVGIKEAKKLGYALVLTMDQDSILEDGCVNELISYVDEEYVSVGPNYREIQKKDKFWKVRYLITSGNLILLDKLMEVGGFNEKMFIDSVDFDISLKIRKAGYKLAVVNNAKMKHSIGEKIVGKNGNVYQEHSEIRHYYIARNHRYIIHTFWSVDPVFCLKLSFSFLYYLCQVRHEHNAKEKYRQIRKGYRDSKKYFMSK